MKTIYEIAEKYGVHHHTARRWLREGIIQATIRVGATVRFDEAEVDAQLKAHKESKENTK